MKIIDELSNLITKWRNDTDFTDLDFVGEVVKIRNKFSSETDIKEKGEGQ